MQMTRRRILAGATVGGVLLAAGCGGQQAQPGGLAMKPATVTYLHFDTGQQVWQQNWASIFSKFEAKYPGSKVQVDSVTQALTNISEKAIATYAGGGTYDVFYGHFTILSAFLGANIVETLDGFLSKDREVKVDDFYPAATERMKGKLYGIAWFTQGKALFTIPRRPPAPGETRPPQLEKEGGGTWDALPNLAKKVTGREGD